MAGNLNLIAIYMISTGLWRSLGGRNLGKRNSISTLERGERERKRMGYAKDQQAKTKLINSYNLLNPEFIIANIYRLDKP